MPLVYECLENSCVERVPQSVTVQVNVRESFGWTWPMEPAPESAPPAGGSAGGPSDEDEDEDEDEEDEAKRGTGRTRLGEWDDLHRGSCPMECKWRAGCDAKGRRGARRLTERREIMFLDDGANMLGCIEVLYKVCPMDVEEGVREERRRKRGWALREKVLPCSLSKQE